MRVLTIEELMQLTRIELTGLLPLWIVVAGALALLLLEVLLKEAGRKAAPVLTGTFLVLAIGSVFHLLSQRPLPARSSGVTSSSKVWL